MSKSRQSVVHRARLTIMLVCGFILFTVVKNVEQIDAQEAPKCSVVSSTILATVQQACANSTISSANAVSGTNTVNAVNVSNSLCFGNGVVKVNVPNNTISTFQKIGDVVDLATVSTVTTTANSDGNKSGIAVLNIQAGLSSASTPIMGVLFGNATLTSAVNATDITTLQASVGNSPVLVHGSADPSAVAVTKLASAQSIVVDGRNQTGDWLRVRLDNGVGWVSAQLLKVTGDIKTLTVLDAVDTRADFLYKNPMQAFTLSIGNNDTDTSCTDAPSGLLLQLSNTQTAHMLINGVDLSMASATVFVKATAKDNMEIDALSGTANLTILGKTIALNERESVRIRLGGKDGLIAVNTPTSKSKYSFAALNGTPLAVLSNAVGCTVGLPTSSGKLAVRVGPGEERGSLFYLTLDAPYKVIGQASDSKGIPWWKIDAEGRPQAWIPQSAVQKIGACDQVAKADIPPVIAAVSQPSGNDASSTNIGDSNNSSSDSNPDFAPTAASIWNVVPGQDKFVGSCAADVAPLNYCPSLLQLTPKGTGLLWKGQELTPYYMVPVRKNVYAYSGPAPEALGPGTIRLTLVFTSPTAWTTTRILSLAAEGGCQHYYTFTGSFLH